MEYELCTRKKLTSLFEFLDKDQDGRITPSCLWNGLTSLQNYGKGQNKDICEFEIEELLRCVPAADEEGGITLKAFLDAEANLLSGLTKLKLLS